VPDGGQTECPTGPDGVPNGAGRGARRGQTDAMLSATSFFIATSSATSFLNAMSPV
jgi:hypothetical protein